MELQRWRPQRGERRPRTPPPSTPARLPTKTFAWSNPSQTMHVHLPGTPQMTTMEVCLGALPPLCLLSSHACCHRLHLIASMPHVPGCATTTPPLAMHLPTFSAPPPRPETRLHRVRRTRGWTLRLCCTTNFTAIADPSFAPLLW